MIQVVVAGQIPPPLGGQNIMIQRLLEEFRADPRIRCRHWVFRFNPDFQKVRTFTPGKILELGRVWWRLWRLRQEGPIDWLLFPSGGPETVPMIRDLALVPVARLASRRLWIQFHAAGIARRMGQHPGLLADAVKKTYQKADGAIVMTQGNRVDPEAAGIQLVRVIPHKIVDENPQRWQPDPAAGRKWVLHVGHQSAEKGTPQLIEGFSLFAQNFPDWGLLLLGEFLASYPEAECRKDLEKFRIADRVEILGLRKGREKSQVFQRGHLLAFPSRAPYESFGLVLVEAMMWGLPILATDWRSNAEVLAGGINRLISHAGNLSREIAGGLEAMARDPERRRVMGESNRALFEQRYRKGEQEHPYVDIAMEDLGISRPG